MTCKTRTPHSATGTTSTTGAASTTGTANTTGMDFRVPSKTIGVIGGGQLGRMLAIAAAQLGFKMIILDPDPQAPAAQIAHDQIIAAYDDKIALEKLAEQSDVITYEFENVPAKSVEFLQKISLVYPEAKALKITQDRLFEKQMLHDLGVKTTRFFKIDDLNDLKMALSETGYPAILKTRRSGYDGKGQSRINSENDIKSAFASMAGQDAILEVFVNFSCEISVIAARSIEGTFATFDIAENIHKNHILYSSEVPANIHHEAASEAIKTVRKIADYLEYVGVFAVEFFVEKATTSDFTIYVNEIAPRVHNSGHWTEIVCVTSQFEQHIRAITGLALGSGKRHSDCIMQNLIGDDIDKMPEFAKQGNAKIHLYGKQEVRPGRKMGHVTFLKHST